MNGSRLQVWGRLAVAAVVVVLAACTNAAVKPDPPAPELSPEEAAEVRVLAEQVEGPLVTSIQAFAAPPGAAAVVEGIDDLAGFIGLVGPEAEQPSVEGCAPMLEEGADGDGDGYPAAETTLMIDCRFDLPPLMFRLTGRLVLQDEDDTDPASGFDSRHSYTATVSDDDAGVPLTVVGERTVQVRSTATGGEYELEYESRDDLNGLVEIQLTYTGTLAGGFESGVLAITGTVVLVTPPDEAQVDAGPAQVDLTLASARLEYDTETCATVLTGGAVAVEDAAGTGTMLGISYAGCGERTLTYNGVPVPPAPE